MTLQAGTAAARQRGAAATSKPGSGGSGPAALLPGTLVASVGSRRRFTGVTGVDNVSEGKVAGGVAPLGHGPEWASAPRGAGVTPRGKQ